MIYSEHEYMDKLGTLTIPNNHIKFKCGECKGTGRSSDQWYKFSGSNACVYCEGTGVLYTLPKYMPEVIKLNSELFHQDAKSLRPTDQ